MSKDTKLIHFSIVDGNEEQIATLARALATLKDKIPFDMEFLVTNDKIRLYDVKYLIKELLKVYEKEKELVGVKNAKKESVSINTAAPVLDRVRRNE